MKRKTLSITLLFMVYCFTAGFASGKIEFKAEQLNYEATFEDTEYNASFDFTNTGESEVTVLEVQSTCGCTVASLDKKTYAPGESGKIEALFKFGQRTGQQHKTIHVKTSEGDFNLMLEVNIPIPYKLSKALLTWRKDEIGQSKSTNIKVNQKTPCKITKVDFINDFLDYKIIEKAAGSEFELQFTPKEGFDLNSRPVRVVINIECADGTVKEAAVYLRVSSR